MLTSDVTLQSPFATWMLAVSGWRVFQPSSMRSIQIAGRARCGKRIVCCLLAISLQAQPCSWISIKDWKRYPGHVFFLNGFPTCGDQQTAGGHVWLVLFLESQPAFLRSRTLAAPQADTTPLWSKCQASVRVCCMHILQLALCLLYSYITLTLTSTMFHPLTCRIEQYTICINIYIYTVACMVSYWDLLRFVEICSPIRSHPFSQVLRRRGVAREPLWSRGGASASRSPGADCRWKGNWHRNMS